MFHTDVIIRIVLLNKMKIILIKQVKTINTKKKTEKEWNGRLNRKFFFLSSKIATIKKKLCTHVTRNAQFSISSLLSYKLVAFNNLKCNYSLFFCSTFLPPSQAKKNILSTQKQNRWKPDDYSQSMIKEKIRIKFANISP